MTSADSPSFELASNLNCSVYVLYFILKISLIYAALSQVLANIQYFFSQQIGL